MSRGLGEMQIIALLAFEAHERCEPPCLSSTDGGFVPIYDLRRHAWGDHNRHLAEYRGLKDSYRCNHPNSFKRALNRLVTTGYAEFREIDPWHCGPNQWYRRQWQNQYRLTAKGLSVRRQVANTYPRERLTTEHSARIEAEIEADRDRRMAEAGIRRYR